MITGNVETLEIVGDIIPTSIIDIDVTNNDDLTVELNNNIDISCVELADNTTPKKEQEEIQED